MQIRDATPSDADSIVRIYNHYIASSTATFEEQELTAEEMRRRMSWVASQSLPWLVVEDSCEVVGYAYATRLGDRSAYRYSVETAIYVDASSAGTGVGTRLYEALLPALTAAGKHVAIAKLSLPNESSVALHEKVGFEKVGHLAEVGFKFGRWLDVGYWRIELEPAGCRNMA